MTNFEEFLDRYKHFNGHMEVEVERDEFADLMREAVAKESQDKANLDGYFLVSSGGVLLTVKCLN